MTRNELQTALSKADHHLSEAQGDLAMLHAGPQHVRDVATTLFNKLEKLRWEMRKFGERPQRGVR